MKATEIILRDPCKYCHKTHLDYACNKQIESMTKLRKIISWRIPEVKILYVYIEDDSGWFRLFGRFGLVWKNLEKYPMIFSERNGYTKFIKIGKYLIKKVS